MQFRSTYDKNRTNFQCVKLELHVCTYAIIANVRSALWHITQEWNGNSSSSLNIRYLLPLTTIYDI